MENVVINGVEYKPVTESSPVKICVLQRGWVFVGYFERSGTACKLTKAKCIRRWGTSKGLGELKDGPLSETVLDECGVLEFDYLTTVVTIDCEAEKWKTKL